MGPLLSYGFILETKIISFQSSPKTSAPQLKAMEYFDFFFSYFISLTGTTLNVASPPKTAQSMSLYLAPIKSGKRT